MIPSDVVKNILDKIQTAIGLKYKRAEQGKRPTLPYLSYKELSVQMQSPHQRVKYTTDEGREYEEKSRSIISITVIADSDDEAKDFCGEVYRWFTTTEGREYCIFQGVTPRLIDTQIKNRTTPLEDGFQDRWGFDVRFDYRQIFIEEIGTVQSAVITNENTETSFEVKV